MNLLSELKLRNLSINGCAKKTGISYGALYPLVHGKKTIEKYLYKLGLTEFNPYKICRKTHGVMFQDKIWFKYNGETLSWNDVKCR